METKEIFAQRLVELREKRGITQQTLADDLWVTRQSFRLYYNADRTINIDIILNISDYFDVSSEYFLGRTKIKTSDSDIKAICEYMRLSEQAIENLRNIPNDSELFIFNLLCETGQITEYIRNITGFALSHDMKIVSLRLYQACESLGMDPIKCEKHIKNAEKNCYYCKLASSVKNDVILAKAARAWTLSQNQINDKEYDELLENANAFNKIGFEEITFERDCFDDLEEMLNEVNKRIKDGDLNAHHNPPQE